MNAGRSIVFAALAPFAFALCGCGHVVTLDEAQFGRSAYVVECHDDAQCERRMARVCPSGYEGFNPGVVGFAAVVTADVPAEAFVRGPARAVTGLELPPPRRRYIRCIDDAQVVAATDRP